MNIREMVIKLVHFAGFVCLFFAMLHGYAVYVAEDFADGFVNFIDFIDYGLFIFGMMFASYFLRGKANRYALAMYAMLIPVIYVAFDLMIILNEAFMKNSTYTEATFYLLSSSVGLWVYRKRIVLSMLLNRTIGKYIKYQFSTRETNFSLMVDKFMVFGLWVDLIYLLIAWVVSFYHGVEFNERMWKYIEYDTLGDPSIYHTLLLVLVQLYCTVHYVRFSINDAIKPDLIGIGHFARFDKSRARSLNKEYITQTSLTRSISEIGMQIAFMIMLYGSAVQYIGNPLSAAFSYSHYIVFGLASFGIFLLINAFEQRFLEHASKFGLVALILGGVESSLPLMAIGIGLICANAVRKIYKLYFDGSISL